MPVADSYDLALVACSILPPPGMEHPPPSSSRDAPRKAGESPQDVIAAVRQQVACAGAGEVSEFGYYATVVSRAGAVFTVLLAVQALLLTTLAMAERIGFLLTSLALASVFGLRAWHRRPG